MPDLNLSRAAVDWIAVGAGAVAVIAVLLAFLAHLRFARVRRDYASLQGDDDSGSLMSAVRRQIAEVGQLRREVATAEQQLATARADLADALRHVAVVRYDAFADMGGRLSFSAALLDDAGDGLVLTSINGRTETRTYAKGIKGAASEHTLSPEEEQAISFAMRGAPGRRAARQRQTTPTSPTVDPEGPDVTDVEGVTIRR